MAFERRSLPQNGVSNERPSSKVVVAHAGSAMAQVGRLRRVGRRRQGAVRRGETRKKLVISSVSQDAPLARSFFSPGAATRPTVTVFSPLAFKKCSRSAARARYA